MSAIQIAIFAVLVALSSLRCANAQPTHAHVAKLSAQPTCPLDGMEQVPAASVTCYFYLGTSAYRIQNFAQAAMHWKRLVAVKPVPADQQHYRLSAYNNLGFLYFLGKGVKTNKPAALKYWHFASKLGHEESTYHLCHAYAEADEPSYDPVLAREYCAEGLRRYKRVKGTQDWDEEVVAQIQSHLRKLGR